MIKISSFTDKRISHFIGKDGKNFIDWTNKFGVLYIFYRNRKIEIWNFDEEEKTPHHTHLISFIEKNQKDE